MSELQNKPKNNTRPSRADWVRYAVLILLWSSAFGMTKAAVAELSPIIVSAVRIWIAIGLLYGWMLYRKHKLPLLFPKPDVRWYWFLAVGLTGSAVPFVLNAIAMQSLDSGLVSILLATMPLSVAFMTHFTIPGDHMTPGKIIGLMLGLLGVVVLIGPSALQGLGGPTTLAQLIVLISAVTYGFNSVLVHFMPETPPSVAAAGMLLVGGIALAPLAIVDGMHAEMPSMVAMVSIIVLGLGATGFGSILYMQTLRSAGPTFLATANYFVPPIAVFIGVIFLNETPSVLAFIALAIIFLGIVLERRNTK